MAFYLRLQHCCDSTQFSYSNICKYEKLSPKAKNTDTTGLHQIWYHDIVSILSWFMLILKPILNLSS